MGRKLAKKNKKRGVEGEYLSRTRAVAKLQLPLRDFRRLCILKNVFPRDPTGKQRSSGKIFYHSKDIRHLLHEPILRTIREEKIWRRRLGKAKGREDRKRAELIKEQQPVYNLFHLVKERYPTLSDCVRDLDDAVSTVALFASLAANNSERLSPDQIATSVRLLDEFFFWVVHRKLLRKVFCTIKGFYLQFEYLTHFITVLVPLQFPQALPAEVDFAVMTTYLEIYHATMQAFALKAYKEEGLQYPPNVDTDALRAGLRWLALSSVKDEAINGHADLSAPQCQIFAGKKFFISREVPRSIISLMLMACGADAVGWDGPQSAFSTEDPEITHHIVDRPLTDDSKQWTYTREFVQPQWIFDSINYCNCLPPHPYRPGVQPPPHLSPFAADQPAAKVQLITPDPEERAAALEGEDEEEEEEEEEEDLTNAYAADLKAELSGSNVKNTASAAAAARRAKKQQRAEKNAQLEHQRRVFALTGKKRAKYNRATA